MEVLSKSPQSYSSEILPVAAELERPAGLLILGFMALHIPLALLMLNYPLSSTLHAFTVLAVGVFACLTGRLDIGAAAAAYITGAEVLWRMTDAQIFWEYGKYASLLIFAIGIFRSGLRKITIPFLYFLLLVPATILTAEASSFATAKNLLSFNLSGPLALFASMCFFSGKTFTRRQFGRILIALIGPVIGILTIAIYSTISASEINFTDESNRVTSGGYGPNQVSAILGLAGLSLVLFIVSSKANKFLKIAAAILCAVLLSQSLLTFSRGGSYMALSGIAVAILVAIRKKNVLPLLFGTICVAAILVFWVLPWMNSFTGGSLEKRYTDFQTTGRVDIVRDDLRIFKEHPFLGVGPGRAAVYRYLYFPGIAAHTEFSRMLAEHGLLGLAAIFLLIAIAIRNVLAAKQRQDKAVSVSLVVWSIAFMFINAMRLVAPAFLFGLTSAQIEDEEEQEKDEEEFDDSEEEDEE